MGKIIVLDPGHGGNDPGAVNGRRLEKDDNLRLALAIRDELRVQGHTALMTREADTNPTPEARIAVAIVAKADLFISLHRNSYTSVSACGIEIWVRYPRHVAAAGEVLEQLTKVTHQVNRGVKTGAFRVLYNAPIPAMLLELGFLSNTRDNELFDEHLGDNATAIVKGMLAALGEEREEGDQSRPLYRVQVGAFGVRRNAEGFLQTIRDMGLPAVIVAPDMPRSE